MAKLSEVSLCTGFGQIALNMCILNVYSYITNKTHVRRVIYHGLKSDTTANGFFLIRCLLKKYFLVASLFCSHLTHA